MSGQRVPMSQATYDKLTKELETLKKVDRPAIIEEIAAARSQGDLAENAEYHAAKERQGQIEANISIMEDRLARSEIITQSASDSDHIIFGAVVKVKDAESGKETEYTLVGPAGVDVARNHISSKSPIGRGLMGKKAGDVIDIKTPKGTVKLEVLDFH